MHIVGKHSLWNGENENSSEGRSVVDAAMVINIINIRTNTIRTTAVLPRMFGICLMVC